MTPDCPFCGNPLTKYHDNLWTCNHCAVQMVEK
jgi:ribosomal protein L37AE/L43A